MSVGTASYYDPQIIGLFSMSPHIDIGWSVLWNGWTVILSDVAKEDSFVLAPLWEALFLSCSLHDVYEIHDPFPVNGSIWRFYQRLEDGAVEDEYLCVRFCSQCKAYRLFRGEQCLGCGQKEALFPLPRSQAYVLGDIKTSILKGQLLPAEQESLYVVALRKWLVLGDEREYFIHLSRAQVKNSLYYAYKLIVGIDVMLHFLPRQEISIDGVCEEYRALYPWIGRNLDPKEWRKLVTKVLAKWKEIGWLERIDKGVYRRVSRLPIRIGQNGVVETIYYGSEEEEQEDPANQKLLEYLEELREQY
jgi:hypothetical protein